MKNDLVDSIYKGIIDTMHHHKGAVTILAGAVTGGISLTEIDLWLAVILKVTSLITFLCFLIMNGERIVSKIKQWFT